MLGMPPEQVRVIHMEGSGCYGHNGADDAAADAALIARALPGRPVRVQWMREQEHAWEPYGPAMVMKVRAALGGGRTHRRLELRPLEQHPLDTAGRRRRAARGPPYRAAVHAGAAGAQDQPLRQRRPQRHSALRHPEQARALAFPARHAAAGLGAAGARRLCNVFAIESFMDELALAAGADPVEFRLRHLEDPRARDVVELAAERFGWSNALCRAGRGTRLRLRPLQEPRRLSGGRARGRGRARDRPRARACAPSAAIDSGEAVNPDGIRNQTEGGILQSISWTLYEAVTFDDTRITSVDWSSYPILRFAQRAGQRRGACDRPAGRAVLGTGEAAQGPTAAAVGNAIRHATGKRLHDLPLTRERVKDAIGV